MTAPTAPPAAAPAATPPAGGEGAPGPGPAAPAGAAPFQLTTPITGTPTPNVVPPGATVAGQPGATPAPVVPSWYADGPEAAAAYVKQATDQAAAARAAASQLKAEQQAAIAAAVKAEQERIGKALGYIPDEGANLDPAKLAEKHQADLAARDQQIRDLTISNALTGALAGTHPGTLDALKGSGRLADLDPKAADFPQQLQTRVAEYLDANPYFRVTPGVVTPVVPPLAGTTSGQIPGTPPLPPGGDLDVDALRAARKARREHG